MAYIKCSGCGTIVEIPPELSAGLPDGESQLKEPYYCDECEWIAELAADIDTPVYCWHCGKDVEDFSDLGCEYCDRRHPDYGMVE